MNNILKQIDKKKAFTFLGILLLFLYLDYPIAFIYSIIKPEVLEKATMVDNVIVILIKYLILLIIFLINYHKYLKEKLLDFKKNFFKYLDISFKNWFIGFIIMIISNMIINSLFSGLGKNEQGIQTIIREVPTLAFLLTTIGAPFIEEMVFRKYLQDSINNKTLYILLSGFIFGFIHVFGFSNPLEYLLIIPYGAIGCMFAKTINETDNIYSTIIMHMLHNGVLTYLTIQVI